MRKLFLLFSLLILFALQVYAATPPTVNAGPSQVLAHPTTLATLAGTATDDTIPEASWTITWSQVKAPENGTAAFVDSSAFDTNVTFSQVGTYVLGLRVDDNDDGATTDYIRITVQPDVPANTIHYNGQDHYINGINVAWFGMGSDIGNHDDWGDANTLAQFDAMFTRLAQNNVNCVRWWIHADGRSSPEFNPSNPDETTGLDSNFLSGMQAILDSAQGHGVMVMPCFWSFDMQMDFTGGAGPYAGMHEEMINDAALTQAYIDNALIPIVTAFDSHPAVIGWEISNEPEGGLQGWGWTAQQVTQANLQRFIGMLAAAIHKNSSKMVTTGSVCIQFMTDTDTSQGSAFGNIWSDTALEAATGGDDFAYLDFYQVHYYDWMMDNGFEPFRIVGPQKNTQYWGLDKPTIIGECPAIDENHPNGTHRAGFYTCEEMINNAFTNGFAGIMPWVYGIDGDQNDPNNTANTAGDNMGNWNTIGGYLNGFYYTHPTFYGLNSGTLSGTVRDSASNNPLSGVLVELQLNGQTVLSQTTDASGTYSFDVAVENYNLAASLTGYNSASSFGHSVLDGQTTTANIALDIIQIPTVSAGADQAIALPTNTANFTCTYNDYDGTITNFEWRKISGPDCIMSNANTSTLALYNLLEGTYVFRIIITDNDGNSVQDDAIITVHPIGQGVTYTYLYNDSVNIFTVSNDDGGPVGINSHGESTSGAPEGTSHFVANYTVPAEGYPGFTFITTTPFDASVPGTLLRFQLDGPDNGQTFSMSMMSTGDWQTNVLDDQPGNASYAEREINLDTMVFEEFRTSGQAAQMNRLGFAFNGTPSQTGDFMVDNIYLVVPCVPAEVGTVAGTILNENNGTPVSGAVVNVMQGTTVLGTDITNDSGEYSVSLLPGLFDIQVAHTNYIAESQNNITILVNDTINLNMNLTPGAGSPGLNASPEAPVISNVRAVGVSSKKAVIIWTTDEESTSVVEYGTDINYEATTNSSNLVTNHSITISNLTPGTEYNFRVTSADNLNNTSTSTNYTFRTAIDDKETKVYPNPYEYSEGNLITFEFPAVDNGGTLKIYSIAGNLVQTIELPANQISLQWDGKDSTGNLIASGAYLYVLTTAEGKIKKGKFAFIK